MRVPIIVAFGLSGFYTFCGFLLSSPVAAESFTTGASVFVPSSCSLSGTGMNSHNANVSSGTYQSDIGLTTLKATCNDDGGFAIYAIGYSNEEYSGVNHTKLIGINNGQTITSGTASSGGTSNWVMKLATDGTATYPITLDNGYGSYSSIPDTYTKVAHRNTGTDAGTSATGAVLTTTYAAYISSDQVADTYSGKVKYVLVHPASDTPAQPQSTTPGYINYYANTGAAEGTMGRQSAADGNAVKLYASNFSRDGYGFAGWSDVFDYETNPNAHFYGPNEDITVPTGTTANGLALYAVWVESEGLLQDTTKVAQLCGTGAGSLTQAVYNDEGDADESTWSITAGLDSVSALTDTRDNQTYAIAKLTDGRCWMIENLRLSDTHQEGNNNVSTTLTLANTNNPLNDGTTVTLKHNYSNSATFTNLSPTSDAAYDASTAPGGWCTANTAACFNQSRLRTDSIAIRATYAETTEMTSHDVNLYSYGNYYNWYSATAGRGTRSLVSSTVEGDLCPSGWHLAVGAGSGELGLLSNSLGGFQSGGAAKAMSNSTSPTSAVMMLRMSHFPNNYLYAGYVEGANIMYRGSRGNYWAGTSTSTSNSAYYLSFTSANVYPGTNGASKRNGRPMRCIANSV